MAPDISFGFNVPVFAGARNGDPAQAHIDTPVYESLSWETTEQAILRAEDLGFDSVWSPDHLLLGRDHAEYECWTLLSATAGLTDDVRIGSLVLCNDFRNPALVAKMAATLDVISDGRLELGLGAGWNEAEYRTYGWEYREGFERLMRLDESVRVIKRMWTEDAPSFDGNHYRIEDAHCQPKPRQDPHPPILIGGDGEEVTLKLVAKHADVWNTTTMRGHPDTLSHKLDVLRDHCESVGRDYEDIEKSWESLVLCTRDEEARERIVEEILAILNRQRDGDDRLDRETLLDHTIVGAPEACVEAIERRVDLGFTTFQLWFVDHPDPGGMERFADEVMPTFA